MNFSAVILAGGKSSRMGRDKAWLEIDGQTLLARQIQLAREAGAVEVFISGRKDADYSEFGCRVLRDELAAGPLAGIDRALNAASSPMLLVLAVDMPNVTAAFLKKLAADCTQSSGVIPFIKGRIEPLVAFYPKASHTLSATLLSDGFNAATNFAERCVENHFASFFESSECDTRFFTNWNAPLDIEGEKIGGRGLF